MALSHFLSTLLVVLTLIPIVIFASAAVSPRQPSSECSTNQAAVETGFELEVSEPPVSVQNNHSGNMEVVIAKLGPLVANSPVKDLVTNLAKSHPSTAPALVQIFSKLHQQGGDTATGGGGSGGSDGKAPAPTARATTQFLKQVVPPLDGTGHKGQGGRIGVLGGSIDYTGAPYYSVGFCCCSRCRGLFACLLLLCVCEPEGSSQNYVVDHLFSHGCGARVFQGLSSLRVGAELLYLFTATEAASAIKSYSPELMVTPVYSHSELSFAATGVAAQGEADERNEAVRTASSSMVSAVTTTLPKLHALTIGPGLGRDKNVLSAVGKIITNAREAGIPLVIDADGFVGGGYYYNSRAGIDSEMETNVMHASLLSF